MNHKATKSNNTALERSEVQTTGGGGGWGGGGLRRGGGWRVQAFLQIAKFILGPVATLCTEMHKKCGSHKGSQLSQCINTKTKTVKLITI